MRALDSAAIPLAGTHLIEASAGTGKTFTIGLLVLRLLLEKGLRMRNLAVVTFTEAAASELAERIAMFIAEARSCVDKPSGGTPIGDIVANAISAGGGPACRALLDRAAIELELARITTIHGFCTRLLNEFSFELGAGNVFETITCEDELIDEILADFWRNQIAPIPMEFQPLVGKLTPDGFKNKLKDFLNFPGIEVLGPSCDMHSAQTFLQARADLAAQWKSEKALLLEILTDAPKRFNRQSYKIDRIAGYIEEVDVVFEEQSFETKPLERFTKEKLVSKITQPGYSLPPALTVASKISAYLDSFADFPARFTAGLEKSAFDFLTAQLTARKARSRVRSFGDLIYAVSSGLEIHGERAAAAIRARFDAVLVDEFQDTDRLQYRIFSRLFAGRDTIFFALIGDPKQAIYRFRGGDIQSYLEAKTAVAPDNCHTLNRNFRSQRRLIEALNRIYEDSANEPFRTPDIKYEPVVPGKQDLLPATLDDNALPPVTLWSDDNGKTIEPARIARAIAIEIARLAGTTLIGPENKRRVVSPGDIAILVNSHDTGRRIKAELAACGIRAVTGRSGSVFESAEAEEISLLLSAFLAPSSSSAVRSLLLCPLYNFDLQRLTAWEQDDNGRQDLHALLETCLARWKEHGVAQALDHFLTDRDMFSGTAATGAGKLVYERRVTNFRHLIEILHTEDERLGRIPERTTSCYTELRRDTTNETYEQRLESDAEAVQIVTMHKAKGLQWPIVFAVELWKDGLFKNISPIYHVKNDLIGDLSPENSANIKTLTEEEILQERQRLAYVTLTRAEFLLYAVTADRTKFDKDGSVKKHDYSPAAWLLRAEHIGQLANNPDNLVHVTPLGDPPRILFSPTEPKKCERDVERWTGATLLKPRWQIGSYSGLTRQLEHTLSPGHVDPTPPSGIFAFPRGAQAGTILHSIFEKIDFMALREPALWESEIVRIGRTLAKNGLATESNKTAVREMVESVLSAPLLPDEPSFSLSRLERAGRATEMEFFLSASHPDSRREALTGARLTEAVGPAAGAIGEHVSLAGYLTGFIDLVFTWNGKWYLLDWKSNHLGNSAAAYSPQAIGEAMIAHNYHLQYLFYTVALCRHLRLATANTFDYDRDFGGVVYLFVRGVDGKRGSDGALHGVFFVKPEQQVVERLEAAL